MCTYFRFRKLISLSLILVMSLVVFSVEKNLLAKPNAQRMIQTFAIIQNAHSDAGLNGLEMEYAFLPSTEWTTLGVHLPSGNALMRVDLFDIPGNAIQLTFGLTYNALYRDLNTGLGRGWMSDLHASAILNPLDASIRYLSSSGALHEFFLDPLTGNYINPPGFAGKAVLTAQGSVRITDLDYQSLNFDTQGRLISMENCRGVSWQVSWDNNDQPLAMTDLVSQRQITLEWSSSGLLESIEDPLENRWLLSYNSNGDLLTSLQQPLTGDDDPLITSFEYDNSMRLSGQLTFEEKAFEMSYYESGNNESWLSSWKDPAGYTTSFDYQTAQAPYSKKTILTNAENQTSTYYIGSQSNHIELIEQSSANDTFQLKFSYDSNGWMVTTTDTAGHLYEFVRNASGRLVSMIYPPPAVGQPSYVQEWIYDTPEVSGRLIQYREKIAGSLWAVTQYLYEDLHVSCLPSKMIHPDGSTSVTEFNSLGQVAKMIVDPTATSQIVQKHYAANGNLSSMIDPEGNESTYHYDLNGRKVMETLFEGSSLMGQVQKVQLYSYDFAGRVTSIKDDLADSTRNISYTADGANDCEFGYVYCGKCYLYDSNVAASRIYHRSPWDDLVRADPPKDPVIGIPTPPFQPSPVLLQYGDGAEVSYHYNKLSQVVSMTNPLGQTTLYHYDDFGRLSSTEDFDGKTSTYTYNDLGKIASKTISGQGTWNYTYNALGLVTQINDPVKGLVQYSYNTRGDLLSDEAGSYSYDIMGRRVAALYAGGGSDQWTYRADGSVVNFNGITLAYNKLGLMTQWSDGGNQATIHYRSSTGLPLSIQGLNKHSSYAYQYDLHRRPSQIQDSSKQQVMFNVGWSDMNMLASLQVPGMITQQISYDAKKPSSVTVKKGNNTLFSSSASFNNHGQRTAYTYTQAPSWQEGYAFSYDTQQRLNGVSYSSNQRSISYAYDAANGFLNQISDSQKGTYDVEKNAQGKLMMVKKGTAYEELYDYTPEGKIESITLSGNRKLTFLWDAKKRISQVLVLDGMQQISHSFSYNAIGNLSSVSRSEQGFASESWNLSYGIMGLEHAVRTSMGMQDLSFNFSRDLNGRALSFSYQQLGAYSGEIIPHFDHKGNMILATDMQGNMLASYQYDLMNSAVVNVFNPQQLQIPFTDFDSRLQLELSFSSGSFGLSLNGRGQWTLSTDWGTVTTEGDHIQPQDLPDRPDYQSFASWDCNCGDWSEGKGKLTDGDRKMLEKELRRRGKTDKNEIKDIIDEVQRDINACCTAETYDGKGGLKKGENATIVFGTSNIFEWWIRCKLFPDPAE